MGREPFTDKWIFLCYFDVCSGPYSCEIATDVCFVVVTPCCLSLKWGTEMKIFVETGNV